MSKATETELDKLHSIVAKALANELEKKEYVEIDGEQVELSTVSPALLGQAIKFLQNNGITSDPELDDNIRDLEDVLKNKQKRGNVLAIHPKDAAQE